MRRDRFLDMFLNRLHVEACAFLHRWKVDKRLSGLSDHLLHEDEARELACESLVVGYRPVVLAIVHSGSLIGGPTVKLTRIDFSTVAIVGA